jgi:hypothetical protein
MGRHWQQGRQTYVALLQNSLVKETEHTNVTTQLRWGKIVIGESHFRCQAKLYQKRSLQSIQPGDDRGCRMIDSAIVVFCDAPDVRLVLSEHVLHTSFFFLSI